MNYYNWLFSALVFLLYIVSANMTSRLIADLGIAKRAAPKRAKYISKICNFALAAVSIVALFFIWGIDYRSILLFGSSILAITGVALFAQWSILSNITASVVIFFNYPARIGDKIRILDGENTVEGTVIDINIFQVLLEDHEQNLINYPNNLLIQKAFMKLHDKSQAN
ncbi:MAG: mechanosensitive ion channel domain-containing protein [Pseudohongiellaceae bacterium]